MADPSEFLSSKLEDKLDFSLLIGMISFEDCNFLIFCNDVFWRGKMLSHDIFEIKTIRFVSINVSRSRIKIERAVLGKGP